MNDLRKARQETYQIYKKTLKRNGPKVEIQRTGAVYDIVRRAYRKRLEEKRDSLYVKFLEETSNPNSASQLKIIEHIKRKRSNGARNLQPTEETLSEIQEHFQRMTNPIERTTTKTSTGGTRIQSFNERQLKRSREMDDDEVVDEMNGRLQRLRLTLDATRENNMMEQFNICNHRNLATETINVTDNNYDNYINWVAIAGTIKWLPNGESSR